MSLSGEAVLYASSPHDRVAQESARQERRRRKVLKELIDTEKRYLHHLQLINKFFYFPLKFAYIVPDAVHHTLFSNLEQIYDINVTLLEQIEQSTIGVAFSHMSPFLKLYSTYANNHQLALSTLQEWQTKSDEFANFIAKQEDVPEVMGLKLPALLIAPVQRIPRYKLLLEELLNNTPAEHYDYNKLKEAARLVEDTAVHINEHIRQNENFQKMLSIQRSFDNSAPKLLCPGRTFIREGPLKKVSRKGGKPLERMFFLFSDILLYGKPGGSKSYTCSCVLPLRHCKVEPMFITNHKISETGGVFKLSCKEENLLLYSDDKENAQQWSDQIDKAIRKFCDDRQTLRKPSSNKIPLRGRSLRRHRREQKKTDTKKYGNTPLRPLSLVRSSSPDSEDASFRTSWHLLGEGHDLESFSDVTVSTQSDEAKDDQHVDDVRLTSSSSDPYPTIQESPTGSVTSHYSLRSRSRSQHKGSSPGHSSSHSSRISPSSQGSRRSRISLKRRATLTLEDQENNNLSPSSSCSSSSPTTVGETSKLKPLFKSSLAHLPMSTSGSSAWFPPNSPAHRQLGQKISLNSRIKSYIVRPFRRVKKAKNDLTNPCSPFRCRQAAKKRVK